MLTTDIKYAVGIDFGHGETSFSYYNITWGKDIAGQTDTITPTIQLLNGDKTIPSIYVYDRSKDAIYIGDEAADIYNIVGDHDNFVYKASFKKPISLMSDEEKSLFIKYMARVKIDLLKCCPKLQDEDPTNNIKSNYIVVIAKPSGWSTNEDIAYLNLAKAAGLSAIGIWPESRASIMRFISKNDGRQANNNQNLSVIDINKIHEGCILMDIGSSTTDFSYINKHKNYPIDDNGNDCGGQIIDELLLQYVLSLQCNEEVRRYISESYNESSYNSLIYQIRKAKEGLFRGTRPLGFNLQATYRAPGISMKNVESNFTICTMETVEKLLNEGLDAFDITPVGKRFAADDATYPDLVKNAVRSGFIPALRYELASFITNHVISDNSQRINCFILTGGTVNVFKALGIDTYFKVNILPEAYRNCAVYTDAEPSTSVSDGLALVGRNYALFKGCTDDNPTFNSLEKEKAKGLKNQLDELVHRKLETVSADSVKEAIADEIRNRVMSKATSAVDKFAGYHDVNPSLDDLKDDLNSAISSGCSNSGETISKHILACLRNKLDETAREIKTLVNKYTVQDVNMPPTDKYKRMSNISINVDADDIINEISTRVSGQVIVGILYLMLYPLATVIWLLTTLFTDQTFDEFFENFIKGANGPLSWVSSRKRLRMERERVQTTFKEKKSDLSYDTYRKIKGELSGIDTIVNRGIKEAIETYKDDAYKAIERVFK